MEPSGIYLSFGSNIKPETNVVAAVRLLRERVHIADVSTVYETAPIGRPEQPRFYNGVLSIASDLPPRALKFDVLREVETNLGRVRAEDKYAARPIDLDILLYGTQIIDEPDLRVPDPDILTRPFLAVPLYELAGDTVIPGSGLHLREVAESLNAGTMHPLVAFTRYLKEEVCHGHQQG